MKLYEFAKQSIQNGIDCMEGLGKLKQGSDVDYTDLLELSAPELIEYWNYPCEEHQVDTADGYILGLHRIPDVQVCLALTLG